MSNVIRFPKTPVRPLQPRNLVLSTEDLRFQQVIREDAAALRARRAKAHPNFERFWSLFSGDSDCGSITGQPESVMWFPDDGSPNSVA